MLIKVICIQSFSLHERFLPVWSKCLELLDDDREYIELIESAIKSDERTGHLKRKNKQNQQNSSKLRFLISRYVKRRLDEIKEEITLTD